MKSNLKKGGASDGSRAREKEIDCSLWNYPKECLTGYPSDAEGYEVEGGEHIGLCHQTTFKTKLCVSLKAHGVVGFYLMIGSQILLEGQVNDKMVEAIEKHWPLAATKIKRHWSKEGNSK